MHLVVANGVHPAPGKVPAPTCSVHLRRCDPLCAQARPALRHRKCSPAVGAATARAVRVRVHGLVARLVVGCRRMFDVGRQRQLAELVQHIQHRARKAQPGQVVLPRQHLCRHIIGEANPRPRPGRVAGPDEGQRIVFIQHPLHQQLDLASAFLVAERPRLDHARIVHHQQIVGTQQGRQSQKRGPCSMPDASTCSAGWPPPGAGRKLRNQFVGQVEIESATSWGAIYSGRLAAGCPVRR